MIRVKLRDFVYHGLDPRVTSEVASMNDNAQDDRDAIALHGSIAHVLELFRYAINGSVPVATL